ncbi:uncharacterized protein F5147DRAFT_772486 [Suillus discolor]|uniref:Uncharacterized protein n=1 Tax=Suillus discolor TaxID=1912936 RepID=A0A9P7F8U5_9AGAM|nr:uncharacterized protein F5147DRAFT_772486 [Suillus discolor]KAG2110219.1 hypothetical protein F5147DRAFT_772486 [Suillus discolor]
MDTHCELQESPRELGCDLFCVVITLMFWSDATHLTTFGNVRLWPVYMYFGNESKYRHCKPSCNLSDHVAYFQKLPDSFKDFAGTYTNGKGVGRECTTHCQRELFQAQWKVLLDDEFLEAYEHGIVILCCDSIKHRFYPRIFTYSADYPEKALIATINNYGVDSTRVESLLKPDSWVPSSNVLSDSLGAFGFNVFVTLVVDLLHEFELGVWHMLLLHLLRILFTLDKDLIHELDKRYRQVPPFGSATIRQFSANTSDMSKHGCVQLQGSSTGLLPEPHNQIVIDLLFTMVHWHGLAKLRMHSDLTLDVLDLETTKLGAQFCQFKEKVCSAYRTQELDREVDARICRQTKEAGKRVEKGGTNGKEGGATAQQPKAGTSAKGKQKASPEQPLDAPLPRQPRRKRSFNLNTYKLHALGDYVTSIHHFGTTDSYSTEPGELEHHTPKRRYAVKHDYAVSTNGSGNGPCVEYNEAASDPHLHHHISQSEKVYDELGHYLRNNARDPAIKDFLPCLKTHILDHLDAGTPGSPAKDPTHADNHHNSILFKHNRIYHHNLTQFNFTSYDVRRSQDVINPKTPHCNIMLLQHDPDDDNLDGNYCYAKVLGDSKADKEDEDHVGVEELIPFEQGHNGSSETLIDALDEMYTGFTLDYEN